MVVGTVAWFAERSEGTDAHRLVYWLNCGPHRGHWVTMLQHTHTPAVPLMAGLGMCAPAGLLA
jgi:hypothetical protein